MPASSDNRLGYWENSRFVRLNDALLRHAGGAWDRPPESPVGMGSGLRARLLKRRAIALLRRTARTGPWGWKDPRNALVMPFWLSVVPSLKVIICLRHPAKVEHSLRHRDHTPSEHGLDLWRIYNERLLATVPVAQRIIVSNSAVLEDPAAVLRPLLNFVGLPIDRAEDPAMASWVRPELQRALHTPEQDCGDEIDALYARMLDEAERARSAATQATSLGGGRPFKLPGDAPAA